MTYKYMHEAPDCNQCNGDLEPCFFSQAHPIRNDFGHYYKDVRLYKGTKEYRFCSEECRSEYIKINNIQLVKIREV